MIVLHLVYEVGAISFFKNLEPDWGLTILQPETKGDCVSYKHPSVNVFAYDAMVLKGTYLWGGGG